MAGRLPKQYLPLLGRPLIWHALAALVAVAEIERVFVVLAPADVQWQRFDFSALGSKLRVLHCGGETRAQSVVNGLLAIADEVVDDDWVLVHDAARACVTPAQVTALIDGVGDDPVGGILAVPVADTLKREDDGRIAATVARDRLWQAQTPQMFRRGLLVRALAATTAVTDEAGAIEALGQRPKLIAGDTFNLKSTFPLDLELTALILRDRNAMTTETRIGQGYDVHPLVPGRKLILGGVEIPHETGLLGHSDADVLLHAITDAILGAAALGDIGRLFPDTDQRWRGADSRVLLRGAVAAVHETGWRVGNVDATVVAQAPRIAPFVAAMIVNIAADLGVAPAAVNVKGKTTERLGFEGRREGISAQAVAMLVRD
jgi:2-C-methyl-D-erythritol 4-phosphate cytidylyltransferase/2-C-methyl-D-erythritol 2,4-cyclodiphosphate synthase